MDISERLRFDAARCEVQFSKGVASNMEEAADVIERLRSLLREADDALFTEAGMYYRNSDLGERIYTAPTSPPDDFSPGNDTGGGDSRR